MDSNYQYASIFLADFAVHAKKLDQITTFTPHCIQSKSSKSEKEGFKSSNTDCLSGGRYCYQCYEGCYYWKPGRGKVMEDLKRICISKVLKKTSRMELWWDYVAEFNTTCEYRDEECSNKVMKKVGIVQTDVDECLVASVENGGNILVDDNLILKKERDEWDDTRWPTYIYSSLVIVNNGRNVYFNVPVLLAEICRQFNKLPEYCQEYFKEVFEETEDKETENGSNEQGISAGILTLIIFACLLQLILLILFCYRRWRRRSTDERMNLNNISASNHIELSSQIKCSI
jgi:hypothetical protein